MAIFGKSKRRQKPSPLPPQPAASYGQVVIHEAQNTHHARPGWSYGPGRPTTSHGPDRGQAWAPTPSPPYPQIFISNYIMPPQLSERAKKTSGKASKLISTSVLNLANLPGPDMPTCIPGAHIFNDGLPVWHRQGTQVLNQGAALYDLISSKFNTVVTLIDEERFSGDERELWVHQRPVHGQTQPPPQPQLQTQQQNSQTNNMAITTRGNPGCAITEAVTSNNYFSKVDLYANSRLQTDLPPVKFYVPTFPLLCLAAQFSERVYKKPAGSERETHVNADWRLGTKAMVIKSVPIDDMNTIVFAIRGSQTFMDWAVNLNSSPASPSGFLDDGGNFCHSGFLSVARKMIKPVAARLRHLLEEDPRRSKCSLVITGHSAGGAVAALLYSHMLATSRDAASELNRLTNNFRRIHCVTFGAPPVSLLPLQKPDRRDLKKSLFLSFINEGDPVTRADTAYVKSLLELYSSPAPTQAAPGLRAQPKSRLHLPGGKKGASTTSLALVKHRPAAPTHSRSEPAASPPIWRVPPSTLSNAGKLILLRSASRQNGKDRRRLNDMMDDGVQARIVTDEQLRHVVFGDPTCHMMKLYSRRIEVLATNAVIGR